MNFYKHYIGDFQRDTGHLSLTQRGAYLCLMHHYYATEKPLPNDHASLCRIAGAIDKAEREAVRFVMGFFQAVDSGLMHKRIEAELEKAGKQADTNRQIAIEREAKRKAEREANEPSTNRATNREPNQTPDTRHQTNTKPPNPRKRGSAGVAGFDVFWEAYPRKANKAQALKRFETIAPDAELLDEMLQAIARQRSWDQWAKDGGKFIPHPASWLNGERWKDEQPAVRVVPFESDKTRSARHAFEQWSGRNTSEVIDAEPTIRALG